jgi:hypothetical protein
MYGADCRLWKRRLESSYSGRSDCTPLALMSRYYKQSGIGSACIEFELSRMIKQSIFRVLEF